MFVRWAFGSPLMGPLTQNALFDPSVVLSKKVRDAVVAGVSDKDQRSRTVAMLSGAFGACNDLNIQGWEWLPFVS
jgi:hypothetical protein